VPAPGFDADGTLSLSVADEVPLTLVQIDGLPGIIAAADLPAGLAGDAELLADLLAANLDWRRVGGATFGKLPGDGPVVLCRLLPVATDDGADEAAGRRLERDLLDFAAVAADWIDDLEQALDLEDAGAAPPPAAPAAAPPRGFA
jgi:hypothetical protein